MEIGLKASVRIYICCCQFLSDNSSFDLCHCGERAFRKSFQQIRIGYSDCQSNAHGIFVSLVGDPAPDWVRKTESSLIQKRKPRFQRSMGRSKTTECVYVPAVQYTYTRIMHQSIPSLTIPPRAKPRAIF